VTYSGPSLMKSTRAGPESPRRSKCDTSRRQKPREVVVQLVEASRDKDSCREQDPEAGFRGVFRVQEPTARGERRPGGRTALHEGAPSKGKNPRSGTGTRQGRQEKGGSRPREREKRWGGTLTRDWNPREYVAAHLQENAEGEETAGETVRHGGERSVTGRLLDGITLEGSRRLGAGRPVSDFLPDTGRRKNLEGRREPRPKRERRTHESASVARHTRWKPGRPQESGTGSR